MADGTIIKTTSDARHWLLTDAAVATGNGVWVEVDPFSRDLSIHVDGITTATVIIGGSSESTVPANSAHGDPLATVTADGHFALSNPPRWIKARVSAWTSGTISVYAVGRMAQLT